MRGRSLLLSRLARIEGDFFRSLFTNHGSGLSLCMVLIGLVLFGVQREVAPPDTLTGVPVFWHSLLPSLAQAAAAFLFAGCGSLVVLCLAASSRLARQFIRAIIAVLVDIPALGWVGLATLFFPSFTGCVLVTASSLCARMIQAVLDAEYKIPRALLKSARALRMTPWQRFWRVQMPVAFPRLVRGIVQDMPDFWIRLMGAQIIMALLTVQPVEGNGAQLIYAMQRHDVVAVIEVFLAAGLVVFLWQHSLIFPLLRRSRRYETQLIFSPRNGHLDENRLSWWQEPRLLLAIVALLLSLVPLILKLHPWYGVTRAIWGSLLHAFPVALLCWLLWGLLGGIMVGISPNRRRLARFMCSVSVLSPFFLLYPFIPNKMGMFFLMGLGLQGALGWGVLFRAEDPARSKLYEAAQRLRLPSLLSWRYARIPLALPSLARAMPVLVSLLWNQVYLAEIISSHAAFSTDIGGVLLSAFRSSSYNVQIFLLVLMTLLAFGVRHALLVPFQVRLSRKYRVAP